jgi:hypothetical protein
MGEVSPIVHWTIVGCLVYGVVVMTAAALWQLRRGKKTSTRRLLVLALLLAAGAYVAAFLHPFT